MRLVEVAYAKVLRSEVTLEKVLRCWNQVHEEGGDKRKQERRVEPDNNSLGLYRHGGGLDLFCV